jgi:cardiolipin synthase
MSQHRAAEYQWIRTGEDALERMLRAIKHAHKSVRLEMYIFHAGPLADEFRAALIAARQRGLLVRVVLDALGSAYLTDSFWKPFRECGGEFRWFNPLSLHRIFIRDHRKILVCDDEIAFIGGINIATEYCGDGVTKGWRDLGLQVRGPIAGELAAAVDEMYFGAEYKTKPFIRLRKSSRQKAIRAPEAVLLLSGPGRKNPLKRALRADLSVARSVSVVTPYFLPPWGLRRLLARLARRGAEVRLILPAKCDLPVVRMAARSLYRRLMVAGVRIYEYEPQILHAKLFVIDKVAYAGSANFDARSLHINHELMLRLTDPAVVKEGREIFEEMLQHSRRIELSEWRKTRTFVDRLMGRLARLIVGRLDSAFASRQLRWWRLRLNKVKQASKHKTAAETP